MKKIKVFISYRRDDGAGYAGRIYDSLKNDFQVFFDTNEINIGEDFKAKISSEIKESSVLLSIIDKNYIQEFENRLDKDDYVLFELESALKYEVPIIPILVNNSQMPSVHSLPNSIRSLSAINGFDIRHEKFDNDSSHLRDDIHKIYGHSKLKKRIFHCCAIIAFMLMLFIVKEPIKSFLEDRNISEQSIDNTFSFFNSSNNSNEITITIGKDDE